MEYSKPGKSPYMPIVVTKKVTEDMAKDMGKWIADNIIFVTDGISLRTADDECITIKYDTITAMIDIKLFDTVIFSADKYYIYDTSTYGANRTVGNILDRSDISPSKTLCDLVFFILLNMQYTHFKMLQQFKMHALVRCSNDGRNKYTETTFSQAMVFLFMTIPVSKGDVCVFESKSSHKDRITITRKADNKEDVITFSLADKDIITITRNMSDMQCLSDLIKLRSKKLNPYLYVFIADLIVAYTDHCVTNIKEKKVLSLMLTCSPLNEVVEFISNFPAPSDNVSSDLVGDTAKTLFEQKYSCLLIRKHFFEFTVLYDGVKILDNGVPHMYSYNYDNNVCDTYGTDDIVSAKLVVDIIDRYNYYRQKAASKIAKEVRAEMMKPDFKQITRLIDGMKISFVGNPGINCIIVIDDVNICTFRYTAFLNKDEAHKVVDTVSECEIYGAKYFIESIIGLKEDKNETR